MRRLQIKKRTAVHYIVNKTKTRLSLQIKSDLKKVWLESGFETVQGWCGSEFVWQRVPCCWSGV